MSEDSGFDNDVNNDGYDSAVISVTNATEVEAAVPTSSVEFRQWVRIVNKGPGRILYGPQGKEKDVLLRNQGVTLNHGPDNKIYLIAQTITCDVLIMESG